MNSKSFRTEITCPSTHPIGLTDNIFTTGSCFADQFGEWLYLNKFNVLVNPFGTCYNPISIHHTLKDVIDLDLDENLFIENQGVWHHFNYHTQWSSQDKNTLKTDIQNRQKAVQQFILKTNVLIITYGTAWVYYFRKQKSIVANCHKVPGKEFDKSLLSIEEISNSFDQLLTAIYKFRPDIRIILTVSPVRHIKDTLVLNSVSKSTLRLACHLLSSKYENVEYFPSYEIMMDDLRDYRFYDRDKIHPTAEALDYISHKFGDQYFDADVKSFIEKWNAIRQSMEHRPFHPHTEAHQQFLIKLLHRLKELNGIVPVEEEINIIQSQINSNV